MARLRCISCQGEYDDVGADGVPYFHACPPIARVRIRRDGQALTVDLADLLPTDERIADVTRERPDRRDENTARAGGEEELDRITGRRRKLRARGRGVTVIDDRDPRSGV